VVAHKPGVLVVAHKLGLVLANAGIDRSNVAPEADSEPVLLLPLDPNASAAALKARLDAHYRVALGVVVSDSVGRAWRNGTTGIALGAAGLPALRDLIGRTDMFGRRLEVTQTGFADDIAAAASLVMGQADEGLPAVLVRGLSWREPEVDATALLRPKDQDLFR
ncbi:MAG: coenzyme F420-0:L-glutamate ligase, partial [Kiloniellales bacterium]